MFRLKFFSRGGMAVTLKNGKEVDFVVTEETPEYVRYESRNCLGEYVPMTAMNDWLEKQLSLLPEELKAVIIPTERVHRDRYGEICKETVKLFLPAAPEIFSEDEGGFSADAGLYKQLDYYKDVLNRVRALQDGKDCTDWYWTSSRRSGTSTNWCDVSRSGVAGNSTATYTWIGAPVCFRVRKLE